MAQITLKPGESVSSAAQRAGITTRELIQANPQINQVGGDVAQVLQVPSAPKSPNQKNINQTKTQEDQTVFTSDEARQQVQKDTEELDGVSSELDRIKQEALELEKTLEERAKKEEEEEQFVDVPEEPKEPAGEGEPSPEAKARTGTQQFLAEVEQRFQQEAAAVDNEFEEIQTILDNRMNQIDQNTMNLVDSIREKYDRIRKETKEMFRRQGRALTQTGIRSGRQRFAPEIQTGIITDNERQKLQKLSEINAEEQTLIQEALTARDDQKFQLVSKKMESYRKKREEKRTIMKDLFNRAVDLEKLAIKEAERQREAMQDQIDTQRQATVLGTMQELGSSDPVDIFASVNFDEEGNQVNDITMEEITGALEESGVVDKERVQNLAQATKENPDLYNDLTPSEKAAVQNELINQGFDVSTLPQELSFETRNVGGQVVRFGFRGADMVSKQVLGQADSGGGGDDGDDDASLVMDIIADNQDKTDEELKAELLKLDEQGEIDVTVSFINAAIAARELPEPRLGANAVRHMQKQKELGAKREDARDAMKQRYLTNVRDYTASQAQDAEFEELEPLVQRIVKGAEDIVYGEKKSILQKAGDFARPAVQGFKERVGTK